MKLSNVRKIPKHTKVMERSASKSQNSWVGYGI
jgi:hypothetical protein